MKAMKLSSGSPGFQRWIICAYPLAQSSFLGLRTLSYFDLQTLEPDTHEQASYPKYQIKQ